MTDTDFNLNVDTSQVDSFLGNLTAKLQGLDPLMGDIAGIIEGAIADNFDAESDPSGSPWQNLADSTIRQRQRKGLVPIRKLQATGKGRSSIRVVAFGGGVRVTVSEDYMDIHDKGGGKIPQRRFIPTQQEVESGIIGDRISAATEAYLNPGLGRFVRGEIRRLRR